VLVIKVVRPPSWQQYPRRKKKNNYNSSKPRMAIGKNELYSLGIVDPKQKKELNDDEELENLADIIKQAMFQDYKVAYSEKGDAHKEEAQATVTVG
jgi:hypothetical protein